MPSAIIRLAELIRNTVEDAAEQDQVTTEDKEKARAHGSGFLDPLTILQCAHVGQEFIVRLGFAEFVDQQFHGFHW